MDSQAYLQRFAGVGRLYGAPALEYFSKAHIAVIGIGGVGSWVVEALARSGIGRLTLIDLDDVCISNTNRQVHALKNTVGRSKIEVMAERVQQINPECELNLVADFITTENINEYLTTNYDYIVDAIDNALVKAALIAAAKRNKIPIITIGGAGGKIDPSQIYCTDLGKTVQDPLLSKVRQHLKYHHGMTKNSKSKYQIDAISSTEPLRYPWQDGRVCTQREAGSQIIGLDCSMGLGAITMVTATFAFFASSRLLQKLANKAAREPRPFRDESC